MNWLILLAALSIQIGLVYLVFFRLYPYLEQTEHGKKILNVFFMLFFLLLGVGSLLIYYLGGWLNRTSLIVDLAIIITSGSGLLLSLMLFRVRRSCVFISYRHEDADIVNTLGRQLEDAGMNVSLVPIEQRGQDATVLLCIEALLRSNLCIFLCRDNVSRWQTAEWFAAIFGDRTVVILSEPAGETLRPRTSIAGYPVCSVDGVLENTGAFATFLRGLDGNWLELTSHAFYRALSSIIGLVVVLKLIQYVTDPLLVLIIWLSPGLGDRIMSLAVSYGHIGSMLLFGSLALLVLHNIIVGLLKVRRTQATLSRENRDRTTRADSVAALCNVLTGGGIIKAMQLEPAAVRSELPASVRRPSQ